MKKNILIGVFIIVLAVFGYVFWKNKTEKINTPVPVNYENLPLVGTSTVTGFYPNSSEPIFEYLTDTSAILNGVAFLKGSGVVSAWFEYGTDPKLSNASKTELILLHFNVVATTKNPYPIVTEKFSAKIEGLLPNTIYYYRAFIKDSEGHIINDKREEYQFYFFTTKADTTGQAPIVRSLLVGDDYSFDVENLITQILLKGEFMGNNLPTETWFEYGKTKDLGLSTAHNNQTINIGVFSDKIPKLAPGIYYYFRAVAKNSSGISYGDIIERHLTVPE